MASLQNKSQSVVAPPPAPALPDRSQIGILLSHDLIFTAKIQGTASALGYRIEVIRDVSEAKVQIESLRPRFVLIDLMADEFSTAAAISNYAAVAGSGTLLAAFGAHVDSDALAAARAAGCHIVLTRSKFARDLPQLLESFFTLRPSGG